MTHNNAWFTEIYYEGIAFLILFKVNHSIIHTHKKSYSKTYTQILNMFEQILCTSQQPGNNILHETNSQGFPEGVKPDRI